MFLGTCYVLVNFSVLAIDAAPLYLGPRSSLTSKVRSHFGVLDSDLLSISELIKQVKGITRRTASSSNVAIIGRWDALKGTDKDRVLIWYLKEGFSDSQILFTEAINPGGAFLHDYISSVKLKSLEEMLLQGRIYLVLICPGYFAPPGMAGILTLVSENSWGNLYVPNSALLPGGPFYAPTSADIKQKIQL